MTFAWALITAVMMGLQSTEASVPERTLCDLYQNPSQYTGRLVKVRAQVITRELWIDDFEREACPAWSDVVVVFPEDVKAPPMFSLERDDALKQLLNAIRLNKQVEATFEGRFDVAFVWKNKKRIEVGSDAGYGRKKRFGARIVLRKVSEVTVRPRVRM